VKRKRFSVEQIVAVVKQAELGLPVVLLLRCEIETPQRCGWGETSKGALPDKAPMATLGWKIDRDPICQKSIRQLMDQGSAIGWNPRELAHPDDLIAPVWYP
jgi:hypothetical protein